MTFTPIAERLDMVLLITIATEAQTRISPEGVRERS